MLLSEYVILESSHEVENLMRCMRSDEFGEQAGYALIKDLVECLHFKDEAEAASSEYIHDLSTEVLEGIRADYNQELLKAAFMLSEKIYDQCCHLQLYNFAGELMYTFYNFIGTDVVLIVRDVPRG